MDSKVEHTENGIILTLYGDATIQSAVDLKGVLARELGGGNSFTVDLAYVTECDVSLFQLLCAAHKRSVCDGKTMQVGNCSPAVSRVILSGGFRRDLGCVAEAQDSCFWQRKDDEVTR
jgi:anti-anti-sigma regulatory factor